MDRSEINNLIHASVVFIVYLFIMILIYFVFSIPIDAIMDGITGAPLGEATDEMEAFSPNIRWAIKTIFAIGVAIPSTWIVMGVLSKEPYLGRTRIR